MTPIEYLTLHLQPSMEPVITSDEIELILESAKRPDTAGYVPSDTTWTPTYDLASAVCEGWKIKAAKVAGDCQYTIGQTQEYRQQIIDHCLKMASRFAGITSVPVTSSIYR